MQINNADLCLYALYRLAGAGRYVHIEDLFVEMWRIAPERFGWKRHDYPNYLIAYKGLHDACSANRGSEPLIIGKGLVRQLTAAGVAWVEDRLDLFRGFDKGEVKAPPDRRPSQRTLAALEQSAQVKGFLAGEPTVLRRHEAAALLRCAPDSPSTVWLERIETLRSAARDARRDDLLRFVEWFEATHKSWFGGST